jgi:hypothetical protein
MALDQDSVVDTAELPAPVFANRSCSGLNCEAMLPTCGWRTTTLAGLLVLYMTYQ